MEVRLAECIGFCFGVKRAVDTVYEQIKTGKTIYTYGPVVNNEEVVKDLTRRGVRVLETKEDLTRLLEEIGKSGDSGEENGDCKVIIRAHGVPEEIFRLLEEKNVECVDATCPFVRRIQKKAEEESRKGNHVVIVGNGGHPEVEGIVGWCKGDVTVLKNEREAEDFIPPKDKNICVVAQTTFNYNNFHGIVEILEKKGYNGSVVNTICNATEERQRSARALAAEADVMIVIGGRHSSNTRRLYEICSEECANTYFIQTLEDLCLELPETARLVGITAGASTPNKLIEEVQ
ncbi:MAG: 4-hydroxy-3-methylbut-2-enyl diphosphate reductase, partial [Lachnospiraceae bacterium]|nr:4-hydroxy-3-methylbut-2-enyl diphosphate reductase [Lachnospiraceae bacterium]